MSAFKTFAAAASLAKVQGVQLGEKVAAAMLQDFLKPVR